MKTGWSLTFDEDAGQKKALHTASVEACGVFALLKSELTVMPKINVLRPGPVLGPRRTDRIRFHRLNAIAIVVVLKHVIAHVHQIVRIVLLQRQSRNQTSVNCDEE